MQKSTKNSPSVQLLWMGMIGAPWFLGVTSSEKEGQRQQVSQRRGTRWLFQSCPQALSSCPGRPLSFPQLGSNFWKRDSRLVVLQQGFSGKVSSTQRIASPNWLAESPRLHIWTGVSPNPKLPCEFLLCITQEKIPSILLVSGFQQLTLEKIN